MSSVTVLPNTSVLNVHNKLCDIVAGQAIILSRKILIWIEETIDWTWLLLSLKKKSAGPEILGIDKQTHRHNGMQLTTIESPLH